VNNEIFNQGVCIMAGHSKWANIQHRKGRQDKLRSKLFSKLSKEITVAAKMGDPDTEKNPRLRLAVKEAKSNSVPKDVIDRAIGKATGGEDEVYDEIRYEGYGPNGVAVIVEAMTDNRNRTASSVRSLFTKSGGNLAETGAVSLCLREKGWLFTKLMLQILIQCLSMQLKLVLKMLNHLMMGMIFIAVIQI